MGECNAELKFLFMPYMAQTDEAVSYTHLSPKVTGIKQKDAKVALCVAVALKLGGTVL